MENEWARERKRKKERRRKRQKNIPEERVQWWKITVVVVVEKFKLPSSENLAAHKSFKWERESTNLNLLHLGLKQQQLTENGKVNSWVVALSRRHREWSSANQNRLEQIWWWWLWYWCPARLHSKLGGRCSSFRPPAKLKPLLLEKMR